LCTKTPIAIVASTRPELPDHAATSTGTSQISGCVPDPVQVAGATQRTTATARIAAITTRILRRIELLPCCIMMPLQGPFAVASRQNATYQVTRGQLVVSPTGDY